MWFFIWLTKWSWISTSPCWLAHEPSTTCLLLWHLTISLLILPAERRKPLMVTSALEKCVNSLRSWNLPGLSGVGSLTSDEKSFLWVLRRARILICNASESESKEFYFWVSASSLPIKVSQKPWISFHYAQTQPTGNCIWLCALNPLSTTWQVCNEREKPGKCSFYGQCPDLFAWALPCLWPLTPFHTPSLYFLVHVLEGA